MFHRADERFEAFLPYLEKSVRIATFHDAQVFARRWVIRDKDPELKALVRRLDRARGGDAAAVGLSELRNALASRGLLRPSRPA